jgi:hypothetical protein
VRRGERWGGEEREGGGGILEERGAGGEQQSHTACTDKRLLDNPRHKQMSVSRCNHFEVYDPPPLCLFL